MQQLNDEEIATRLDLYAHFCQDESLSADEMPKKLNAQLCESDFKSLPHSKKCEEKIIDVATYLISTKQFEELKTIMHQALECLPTHTYFRLYLAIAYYFTGEFLVALSLGRSIDIAKIVSIESGPSTQEMSCDCPGCGSELSSSMLVTDLSAETKVANEIQALFHDIHQLNQAKEYDQAIELYEELFAQVGEPPCLLVDLAVLYRRVNNLREAKKVYTRALKGNPGLYKAYRELAATHRLLDEYELAIGVLKKAHQQFPEDDMILLELAAGYFKLGHTTKAVTSLEKALVIDPSMEHSLANMPELDFLLGLIREKKTASTS